MAWYLMLALYINLWGWIFGIVAYGVSINIIAILLKKTLNLEMMGGADEIFFQEDDRNCANIVAFMKFEKFDPDTLGKTLMQRALTFPRIKSKVTKFLGKYMFEEMTDKQMMDS